MIVSSYLPFFEYFKYHYLEHDVDTKIEKYRGDIATNIGVMLTGTLNGSWINVLFLPIEPISDAKEHPLNHVDYMKFNKSAVERFLQLKNMVEYKLNEKFIQKGLKVKTKDYMQYINKLTF